MRGHVAPTVPMFGPRAPPSPVWAGCTTPAGSGDLPLVAGSGGHARRMTLQPADPAPRGVEMLVDAAASAHAASVCGSLLRERIEASCVAGRAADLAKRLSFEQIAAVAAAAADFEHQTVRMLDSLDRNARLSTATIAQAARDMTRATVADSLRSASRPGQSDRGAVVR